MRMLPFRWQMEQCSQRQRSVKVANSSGVESFETVVLDSIHYESHLMCTNCGPLGLKGDAEPDTSRAALSDRSWAHVVHATDDDGDTADIDFDAAKAPAHVKAWINELRVCACLIAYVLIFIKEQPSLRPDLTYASLLTNQFDDPLE